MIFEDIACNLIEHLIDSLVICNPCGIPVLGKHEALLGP